MVFLSAMKIWGTLLTRGFLKMKSYRKKVREKVYMKVSEWLYNTRDSVKLEPIQGMFNLKCHENSVEYARANEGHTVVMGIYTGSGRSTLHFWPVNPEGKHLEVTLGHQASDYIYYPLRTIPESDYANICGVFEDAFDYLTDRFSTRFERFILNGERFI